MCADFLNGKIKDICMYGGINEVRDGVVLGSGAVILPHTGESTIGTVVAYAAITLGATALISHLVARAIRRAHR